MNLEDHLYWDMLSELVTDDLGAWEFAWRANTLAQETTDLTRQTAANVILRMVAEGVAVVVDRETNRPLSDEQLSLLFSGLGWADARPTVMPIVKGSDKADQRVREMPQEAMDLIARGW